MSASTSMNSPGDAATSREPRVTQLADADRIRPAFAAGILAAETDDDNESRSPLRHTSTSLKRISPAPQRDGKDDRSRRPDGDSDYPLRNAGVAASSTYRHAHLIDPCSAVPNVRSVRTERCHMLMCGAFDG